MKYLFFYEKKEEKVREERKEKKHISKANGPSGLSGAN